MALRSISIIIMFLLIPIAFLGSILFGLIDFFVGMFGFLRDYFALMKEIVEED